MIKIMKSSGLAMALLGAVTFTFAACGSSSSSTTTGGGGTTTRVYWGNVYTDNTGATPKAGATVTVNDSQGAHQATTDANGYFELTAGAPGAGATTSVNAHNMASAVTSGDCNSCHVAGGLAGSVIWAN